MVGVVVTFISISSRFEMTDNNTFLAVSPADIFRNIKKKQLIVFVKFHVYHSTRFLISYVNYP